MMWPYAIKNKITAALLLLAIVVLVVLTNFSERSNAEKISETITSIYKDRLIVEGYIFQYSGLLESIEENMEGSTVIKKKLLLKDVAEIEQLNQLYADTKLTPEEKIQFESFTALCKQLKEAIESGKAETAKIIAVQANKILYTLSGIQMQEAKLQMDSVQRMSSFSTMISQFELGILIVIGLVVQVLIFTSKTIAKLKYQEKAHLN